MMRRPAARVLPTVRNAALGGLTDKTRSSPSFLWNCNQKRKRSFSSSPLRTPGGGRTNNGTTSTCCEPPSSPSDVSSVVGGGVKLVDVSDLAHEMRASVRAYAAACRRQHHPPPRMVGILAAATGSRRSEGAAETYSHTIAAAFAQDGLEYRVRRCAPEAVEDAVRAANNDPSVHGVLVFYPVFAAKLQQSTSCAAATCATAEAATGRMFLNPATGTHYKTRDDYLRDCVAPAKDVEGLCSRDGGPFGWGAAAAQQQHRRLFRARGGLHGAAAAAVPNSDSSSSSIYIPCTAQAVLKILERYHLKKHPQDVITERTTSDNNGDDSITIPATFDFSMQQWRGSTVTVINRSTILGRPLSALLALQGATVYSVDDRSILQFQNGSGDGGGRRCDHRLLLRDCLEQSSVIVTAVPGDDFGLDCRAVRDHTTIVDVAERSNVCLEELRRRSAVGVQLISNVGKVTVAALEQNLVRLHQQHIAMS